MHGTLFRLFREKKWFVFGGYHKLKHHESVWPEPEEAYEVFFSLKIKYSGDIQDISEIINK